MAKRSAEIAVEKPSSDTLAETVRIALICPSRYDGDGYVIQWWRSWTPSNSLAVLNGIVRDSARRQIHGSDVHFDVRTYDERNTVIDVRSVSAWVKSGAPGGFVGLVGVQSNQYPRALDIALQVRDAGIDVVIGGFHVSGCAAMLPDLPPDLQEAVDAGVILFVGDAEGHMDSLLRDLRAGNTRDVYNYLHDLPGLENQPLPMLPDESMQWDDKWYATLDAGRGCPFECSFCSIINVQGRKSRYRTADDIEGIVRQNVARGVVKFLITDDNFARNKNWEQILDRITKLRREEGMKITLSIQVDVLAYKIKNFISKCRLAGVTAVFVGMENINPENLADAKKKQNRIWEYREMFQAWRNRGILIYAGNIIGFAGDTPQRVERDVRIIMDELPIDILRFTVLTPLPGSEDHARLHAQGVNMDQDMNNYTLDHVVIDHPRMARSEWARLYRRAWDMFYTNEHIERVLRRQKSRQLRKGTGRLLLAYKGSLKIEGVAPEQGGVWRRKVRKQRRRGMSLENPVFFYLRRSKEIAFSTFLWTKFYLELRFITWKIDRDPSARYYSDRSLQSVGADEQQHESILMTTYGNDHVRRTPVKKAL